MIVDNLADIDNLAVLVAGFEYVAVFGFEVAGSEAVAGCDCVAEFGDFVGFADTVDKKTADVDDGSAAVVAVVG